MSIVSFDFNDTYYILFDIKLINRADFKTPVRT
jgi:hypothetical protein